MKLTIFVFLFAFCVVSFAQEAVVTLPPEKTLKLRGSPSPSAEVVGTLYDQEKVKFSAIVNTYWVEVTKQNGKKGFAYAKYIYYNNTPIYVKTETEEAEPTPAAIETATEKGDRRKCPNFWNTIAKDRYPTRQEYIVGLSKLVGTTTINYTQGAQRWSGITARTCPPAVPKYADCSAFTTWAYWTAFGGINDIVNGLNWTAGYTGSMKGTKVQFPSACQAGDFILYPGHVATYTGNNEIIDYGHTGPVLRNKATILEVKSCNSLAFPWGKLFGK